ncbi:DUF3817 domain-containing protein [Aquibacillus koreensis]|uniref:DUF3817 domain-containing protein n=1 Tax=Aquibacillus koreensis TaxID=279446 RepID=A0A9X3WRS8_9BACI|nr:DUF3817 domain-containing protein [Aquibacillus koreensis]MCT2536227.1 DUF3817 domain-containing protein [Aquibacillus koreensis]MDC3422219.1 DUF3817 domain-containing protein [Aquibacillus koreensis]
MVSSKLQIFRITGFLEGTSLLALLFIAMPFKYIAGLPEVVTVVGALHGGLFCLYLLVIAYTTIITRWNWRWVVSSFLVAFIPFGNYVLDRKLQQTTARTQEGTI